MDGGDGLLLDGKRQCKIHEGIKVDRDLPETGGDCQFRLKTEQTKERRREAHLVALWADESRLVLTLEQVYDDRVVSLLV
jgi:hypothetical protein